MNDFRPVAKYPAFPSGSPVRTRPSSSGLTAIEVLISLLLLSVVTVFSVHALEFTRRVSLETDQYDRVAQISRDVLKELKSGTDWRTVKQRWESVTHLAAGTEINVQLSENPIELEGATDIELTISWVSPKGLQQEVFNTTVFDRGEPAP